jgi:putative hydrolase of the HAD superfamily
MNQAARSLPANRYAVATPVRAVLFDAVGTLLTPQPSVAEAYLAAGRRFGSRLEIGEVRARFREAFRRQERLDAADSNGATSQDRERRRWQAIVAEVFDDVEQPEQLFEALWRHFARAEHWRLFDDVPRACQRLEEAGLLVGIASNFDARLESIVADMPRLTPCRERVFVSSRLGCRKPCVEFFRAIERSMGLRAEQLLLVGDDLDNDYCGARAADWQAVLLVRDGAAPAEIEHWITSLEELDIPSYKA